MYTQLESLKKIAARSAEREHEILSLLQEHGCLSRRQLAQLLEVESNSVTSAVQNLLKAGFIVERGIVLDPETNCRQKTLVIADEASIRPTKQTNREIINDLTFRLSEVEDKLQMLIEFLKFLQQRDVGLSKLAKEFKAKS